MRRAALILMAGLSGLPAMAQTPDPPPLMNLLGPILGDLLGRLEDLGGYALPEVLPNGDILIRRKPQPTAPERPQPPPQGEVEL